MNKLHTLTLHTQIETITIHFSGTPLLMDVLQTQGIVFAHPCGGRGVCGKCAVVAQGTISQPNEAEQKAGTRLSCQLQLLGDCSVTLKAITGFAQQTVQQKKPDGDLGMAVDVGTTTLDVKFFDLCSGELTGEASALNPQAGFAADVIGRITAAMEGKGEAMRRQLVQALEHMMQRVPPVSRAVITGNTVMLYLLTGRNPAGLAAAPFLVDCRFGHTEQLLSMPVYLPRCIGAFTGADLTCALLASGITDSADTALLCDIGTNGEMALWHHGALFVASAAVGPAFEGAGISCGMGGVKGAIDKVWAVQNTLDFHVIGGGEAQGLCGSGLMDTVAALLQLRWMDAQGTMDGEAVVLADGVSLTQQDIRQVQLAKAAVAAGIQTLMDAAGVLPKDIQTLYLAGGFGRHINVRSAAAIGLFPRSFAAKAKVLGNAALAGAGQILLDHTAAQKADHIAKAAKVIQLSGNPQFAKRYIHHMNF